MSSPSPHPSAVAELQGIFGAFEIPEQLLQRIWLSRRFLGEGVHTRSGRTFRLAHPGRWNHQEGPDFREAVFELDGERRVGDVELHFYTRDWFAHGHHEDVNFSAVRLHVVLFPPKEEDEAASATLVDGTTPETLVLLPLLEQDLESFLEEDALLSLEGRAAVERVGEALDLPPLERKRHFRQRAHHRWEEKVAHARRRVDADGPREALHQLVLEALGYARNRVPMAALALEWPLARMRAFPPDPEHLFASQRGWRCGGIRPPNHPRRRLEQYCHVMNMCPDWPELALRILKRAPGPSEVAAESVAFRKRHFLNRLRDTVSREVFARAFGGTRLETLIVDALLPVAAATEDGDWFAGWFHWFLGDVPASTRTFLQQAEIAGVPGQAFCNGWAQGFLEDLLEARRRVNLQE